MKWIIVPVLLTALAVFVGYSLYSTTIGISQELSKLSCDELRSYINFAVDNNGNLNSWHNKDGSSSFIVDPEMANEKLNANCQK